MEHYSGGRRTTARMAQDNTTLSEKSHTQRTSITWFLSHGIHRTGRKADTQVDGGTRGGGGAAGVPASRTLCSDDTFWKGLTAAAAQLWGRN